MTDRVAAERERCVEIDEELNRLQDQLDEVEDRSMALERRFAELEAERCGLIREMTPS